jgi:hypothetical protein
VWEELFEMELQYNLDDNKVEGDSEQEDVVMVENDLQRYVR